MIYVSAAKRNEYLNMDSAIYEHDFIPNASYEDLIVAITVRRYKGSERAMAKLKSFLTETYDEQKKIRMFKDAGGFVSNFNAPAMIEYFKEEDPEMIEYYANEDPKDENRPLRQKTVHYMHGSILQRGPNSGNYISGTGWEGPNNMLKPPSNTTATGAARIHYYPSGRVKMEELFEEGLLIHDSMPARVEYYDRDDNISESLSDFGEKPVKKATYVRNGYIHRKGDLPARYTFTEDGVLISEEYFKENRRHRNGDQPSLTEYSPVTQRVIRKMYHKDGLMHRENGHAWSEWNENGELQFERMFREGKRTDLN